MPPSTSEETGESSLSNLRIGAAAKGGTCVARHDGRVVFVRGAIPGEVVNARVTDDSRARFWWAEATEILEPSPERRIPPCPVAGRCGGCDYQHISLAGQRRIKAQVLTEQLRRLAGLDLTVGVEDVGPADGLGWRTRMRYLVRGGHIGLRAARSRGVVDLPHSGCLLADPRGRIDPGPFLDQDGELRVTVADSGVSVLREGKVLSGEALVRQRVGRRDYLVRADGFWQVHPQAAEVLSRVVVDFLEVADGESALDLYCGVGLFAGTLVDAGARVVGVEVSKPAIELARHNVPEARFHAGRTERSLERLPRRCDLVVLDPPRAGAGREVVRAITARGARAVCYVACDPAALARDLGVFFDRGYTLDAIRAFDLFPMTNHVETVCLLVRRNGLHINIDVDVEKMLQEKRGQATYPQIKEYVLEQTGMKVSSLYISQIKRKCGLEVGDSYNKPKSEEAHVPQCPPEKEKAIMDALRHFGMVL